MPAMTMRVLHTSVEKCSASASSASLEYFFATRESARARVMSIDSANTSTRIAVTLAGLHDAEEQSREAS